MHPRQGGCDNAPGECESLRSWLHLGWLDRVFWMRRRQCQLSALPPNTHELLVSIQLHETLHGQWHCKLREHTIWFLAVAIPRGSEFGFYCFCSWSAAGLDSRGLSRGCLRACPMKILSRLLCCWVLVLARKAVRLYLCSIKVCPAKWILRKCANFRHFSERSRRPNATWAYLGFLVFLYWVILTGIRKIPATPRLSEVEWL